MADAIHMHNLNAPDGTFKPNLKGFMVGNGVTNYRFDTDPTYIEMGYYHSLYSQETRDAMIHHNCNYSMIYFPEYYDKLSPECQGLYDHWQNVTSQVNIYDIFGYCYKTDEFHSSEVHERRGLSNVRGEPKPYKKFFTAKDYTPWTWKSKART